MADDIVREEFERNATGNQINRTAAGEDGTAGGANSNADLREKGDADDIAEVVLQTDDEAATSEIGLRSDSPIDLTRADIAENGRQSSAVAAEVTPVVGNQSDNITPDAPPPGAEIADGAIERRDAADRTRPTNGAVDAEEIPTPAATQALDGATDANGPPTAAAPNSGAGNSEPEVAEDLPASGAPPSDKNAPVENALADSVGNGGIGNGKGQGVVNGHGADLSASLEAAAPVTSIETPHLDQVTNAGNAKDILTGGADDDVLNGDNRKDILDGGAGDDTLTGGNGNDTFVFGEDFGDDIITDFKPGNDRIDLSALGIPDFTSLLSNAVMDGSDTVITTDQGTITLSDVSLGDLSRSDFAFGEPLTGGDTPPTGDAGDDTLSDSSADDTFVFGENFGDDVIADFTPGNDRIDLSALGIPDLATLLENAASSGSDTVITTDQGTLTLSGIDPSDLSADDFVFGDAPDGGLLDTLGDTVDNVPKTVDDTVGDTVGDTIIAPAPTGDTSTDTVQPAAPSPAPALEGDGGANSIDGTSGADIINAGAGDDRAEGGDGNDILDGGAGDDRLDGDAGNDVLAGGEGRDRIDGGTGDDVIDGGAGNDSLKGGSGADTFVFDGEFGDDTVRDFRVGQGDSIDLSGTEIADFRTLMDNAYQDGNNTVIDIDGGSITLKNVDRNDLTNDDFAYSDSASAPQNAPGSVHEIPDLPAFDTINAKTDGANGVPPDAVTVSSAQTVTMTFESESAGYQSSVGHYTVDADGVIQNVGLAWENASLDGSGGDLVGGESQVSFDVDAGSRVGVFVVPNGNRQNDFGEMTDGHFEFRDEAGEPATINTPSPALVFVHDDGNETTIDSQSGEIFHSAGPNMHGDDLEHSVSGVDANGDLMIGFEDLVGGGDQDYQDVVVKIEFEPNMDAGPVAPESAAADGAIAGADIEAVGFDFVGDEAGTDETVFNLDFSEIIPEGADEGQFEVRVNGLPGQVSASKGEVDSDRNWTLTMMQVVGLTIAVPTTASAAGLMEDITFQVVDTGSGEIVAEGLLDGAALEAGETTIAVLPPIVADATTAGSNGSTFIIPEQRAAEEETQAAEGESLPVEEATSLVSDVLHAPAAAAAAVPELLAAEDPTAETEAATEPAAPTLDQVRNDGPAGETTTVDGNGSPTDLAISASTVAENAANGTAVGTVSATDPDSGETFTYSLVDDQGGRFAVDASTGAVTVADGSLLDYESATSHDITVRVTDSAGATYDETMTVNLTNVYEAATDMAISASSVAENAANGTTVGTVTTTDADAGETYTYTLLNDQGGRFAIDTNTGVVTVADGSLLDYETRTSHDLTVRVTDSAGATYDETMTINLTNANETPTDLKLTNVEIAEGAANGTSVGTAAVTDADAGDTATYSLANDAGGRFTIDSATGEITVADGSLLDYQDSASHDITVRVTDGGGNTYDETYTIGVNDEAEAADAFEAEVVGQGPVGYWRMNEENASIGDHTMSATVGRVDATIHNTSIGTENGPNGNISSRLTDFGTDDYMAIPDDAAWQLADGTVQLVFKSENTSGQQALISRDSTGTNEGDFKVYLNGDDIVVALSGTNGGTLTAANVVNQSSWYQIDVTFGADGLEIWLNGTRVASDPSITGGIDGTTEPWVIGASSSNTTSGDYTADNAQWESDLGAYFDGDIGEFAIFDRQLDSAEIGDMVTVGTYGEDLQTLTAGNDTDSGSAGVDMIDGGAGNDTIGGGNRDDFLYGGDGDDIIDGGDGDDVMSGGAGTDTADYSGFGSSVTVNLETGTATDGGGGTDTLSGFENVLGTNAADTITGNDADNVLTGSKGNDILSGGDGDDTLYGGDHDDTLTGGAGDDILDGGKGTDILSGGAGIDTVTYANETSGVTANLATGAAIDGSGNNDTLSGIENLIGSINNDTFTGNNSANEFTGGDGSDRFIIGEGGTGMDIVHGGTGAGWTDTIQLMNADSSSVGGGWTVQLDTGTVASDDGSTMTLTDDAAGTITLDDGSQIAFDGLEKIEY